MTMDTMTPDAPAPDYAAIKTRQNAAWASGDYARIGTTLQITGESLAEAMDLPPGATVLDVAAGNGNATLAFARRWCAVTSTDYVETLLARGRARAEAEGLNIAWQMADAERLPFADGQLRRRGLDLRRDVRAGPGDGGGRDAAGLPPGRADRHGELDAGGLHRPALPHAGQARAAAGRGEVAGALGQPALDRGDLRRRRPRHRRAGPQLRLPLPLAGPLHRGVPAWYGPVHKAFLALDPAGQAALAADLHDADRAVRHGDRRDDAGALGL